MFPELPHVISLGCSRCVCPALIYYPTIEVMNNVCNICLGYLINQLDE